jgi:formate dehydrogenase major subunit
MGLAEEECVLVSSRRGTVEVPVHVDHAPAAGARVHDVPLPDQVDTNVLTIEATDPRSGTAEFKAAAVRIDKMPDAVRSRAGPGVASRP